MNTDFRVSVDFSSNFKIKKLKKKLGADGVLSLFVLWSYAAKHRPEGVFYGMGTDDIELVAEWDGQEGVFVEALLELKLLKNDENDVRYLHGWNERNPWVTTVNDRQDRARFSRLAAVNRQAYDDLRARGIESISKSEYESLTSTKNKANNTELLAPSNDRQTTVNGSSNDRPTPSPSPTPNVNKNIPPHKPPQGGGCVGGEKNVPGFEPDEEESAPKADVSDQQPKAKPKPPPKASKTAKAVKPNTQAALKAEIAGYARSPDLQNALKDFCEMREKIRKPLTVRALQLIFEKLDELSAGDNLLKVQILEQSVMSSWQGVFPLKSRSPGAQPQHAGTLAQRNLATARRVLMKLEREKEQENGDSYAENQ